MPEGQAEPRGTRRARIGCGSPRPGPVGEDLGGLDGGNAEWRLSIGRRRLGPPNEFGRPAPAGRGVIEEIDVEARSASEVSRSRWCTNPAACRSTSTSSACAGSNGSVSGFSTLSSANVNDAEAVIAFRDHALVVDMARDNTSARSGTSRPCSSRTSRSNALRLVRYEPVDVVAERPALGAGRPDAIARAAHRDVAIVGAGRAPRRSSAGSRRTRGPTDGFAGGPGSAPGARPRGTSVPARPRSGRHRARIDRRECCMSRWFPSAPGVEAGRCRRERGERDGSGRASSTRISGGLGPRVVLLLAMADAAAHPALLRPTLRRPLPRRRLAMRSPLGCRGAGIRTRAGRVRRARGGPKGRFYTEIDRILKADMLIRRHRDSRRTSRYDRRSLRPRVPVDVERPARASIRAWVPLRRSPGRRRPGRAARRAPGRAG